MFQLYLTFCVLRLVMQELGFRLTCVFMDDRIDSRQVFGPRPDSLKADKWSAKICQYSGYYQIS